MANTKISSLTNLATSSIASGDLGVMVDVSDTTQAATGTTKRYDLNDTLFKSVGGTVTAILSASGTVNLSNTVNFSGTPIIATVKPTLASNGCVNFTNPTTTSPNIDIIAGTASGLCLRATDILTDATQKQARFATRHYTNSEKDVLLYYANNTNAANIVYYGGASSLFNCVTEHNFFCGTAINQVTGAQVVRIKSGTVDITGLTQTDSLRIDQTPTASTFTATHYFTISLNGTTYRVPCAV